MKKRLTSGLMIACMLTSVVFTTVNATQLITTEHSSKEAPKSFVNGYGYELKERDRQLIHKYTENNTSKLAQILPVENLSRNIYFATEDDNTYTVNASIYTNQDIDFSSGMYTPIVSATDFIDFGVFTEERESRDGPIKVKYSIKNFDIYEIDGSFYALEIREAMYTLPDGTILYGDEIQPCIPCYQVYEPFVEVVHKTIDGEVLKTEILRTEDLLVRLVIGDERIDVSSLEILSEYGFDYIDKSFVSGKKVFIDLISSEFEGYYAISKDVISVDAVTTNSFTFYYEKGTPTISTLELDTKGNAALSVKYVDKDGVELDSTVMPNILPGRYSVEPRLFDGYSTDDTTQEVVLNDNDEKEIIFTYKKKLPIAPVTATGTSGMVVLLFAFSRKGIVIKRKNENGTTTLLLKTRLKGNSLDVTDALKLAEGDKLEITILKHIVRKKGGQDICIKGIYEERVIEQVVTIPTELNKEYTVEI